MGGYSVLSFAETKAATPDPAHVVSSVDDYYYRTNDNLAHRHASASEPCTDISGMTYKATSPDTQPNPRLRVNYRVGQCWRNSDNTVYLDVYIATACPSNSTFDAYSKTCNQPAGFKCDPTGGWALSGDQCTRPDCRADQIRDGTSGACQCSSPKVETNGACMTPCPGGYHNKMPDDGTCAADCIGDQVQKPDGSCACNPTGNQLVSFSAGGGKTAPTAAGCFKGCTWSLSSVGFCPGAIGALFSGGSATCYTYGKNTGGTCGSNTASTSPSIDAQIAKAAPLAPPDTSGTGADGKTPDPKNTPQNAADPVACGSAGGSYIVYNGVGKCLDNSTLDPNTGNQMPGVTSKSKTSSTTNPDGTNTITTDDESVIKDPKTGQTITIKKGTTDTIQPGGSPVPGKSGSTSSTETGDGSGSGSGGKSDAKGQCALEPDSPLCKKGTFKDKGTFESRADEIEAAKTGLLNAFNRIRGEASALFAGALPGGVGSLPCDEGVNLGWTKFSVCLREFESGMSVIGVVILAFSGIFSLFVIMRR